MNEGFTPLEGDKDSACLILLYLYGFGTGDRWRLEYEGEFGGLGST